MQLILLDIEALRSKEHHDLSEIVELGAVKLRSFSDSIVQIDTFQSFIHPELFQISRNFRRLTHIDKEMLESAESFCDVLDRFKQWIGDEETIFIGWSTHDRSMMIQNCKLHELDSSWICESYVDLQEEVDRILGSKTNTGLKTALDQFGLEFEGSQHRALDDALNTSRILKKILPEASKSFLSKLYLNGIDHSEIKRTARSGHGGKIDEKTYGISISCRNDAQWRTLRNGC